jgi:hypothetical protein
MTESSARRALKKLGYVLRKSRQGPRDEFTERRSWLLYVLENAVRDAAGDLRRCSLRSKAGA